MPDYTTALGQVRLLISDVDEDREILTDDMIGGYLTMWGAAPEATDANRGAVKRAAADALDAIATSEALVSKVIKSQDLSTNGPQVAKALREHAAALRTQAADEDADVESGYFGAVEFSPYPTGRPEAHTGWY